MFLTVTDIAPSIEMRARVTGLDPNTAVRLYGGVPGGPTCSTTLPNICLEMDTPRLLASGTADAFGRATMIVTLPSTVSIGNDFVFQAVNRTSPNVWAPSNAIHRVAAMVGPSAPPGGNVLVIMLDDVGVDSISAYGPEGGGNTPRIDALADGGVRFDNAWAMPICAPTRAAMVTGRLPRRTGYGSNVIPPDGLNELHPDQVTIGELAHITPWYEYQTALIGKWHLSTESSPSGLLGPKHQGFDVFYGTSGNIDRKFWIGPNAPQDAGYYHWQRIANSTRITEETTYATTKSTDDALAVIGGMAEPWVTVVSYNASHSPWEPPPAALHTRGPLDASSPIPELHRAMTEAMDTEIGRLLDNLPAGQLDRTTVILFGDNGTKQEAILPPYNPHRGKREVYDGGVRVPFVVSGPGVAQPGAVSAALVSVTDIFATVADITGAPMTDLRSPLDPQVPLEIDGISLLPVLADPSAQVHDVLYTERFAPGGDAPTVYDRRAVRNDRYKLVYDAIDDREQFFEYIPGAIDEGPDLIACGMMTPALEAARVLLRARMDAMVVAMPMDTAPYVDDLENWQLGEQLYDESPAPVAGDSGTTGDTAIP
ncbi:MAG: sulfatase-like hydrolase/transferase [Myxococcales bacterium]|nr:sulfatase-like hydrolase/transferase [Myxococcales bacterium]